MTHAYEHYGIKNGQQYSPANGSKTPILTVLDVDMYADCDDVIVYDSSTQSARRIDAFKLAMVRYSLIESDRGEDNDRDDKLPQRGC